MKTKELSKLMIIAVMLSLLLTTNCKKDNADPTHSCNDIPELKIDPACVESQQGLTRYRDTRNTLYIDDTSDSCIVVYIAGWEDHIADPPDKGDYIRVLIFADPFEIYVAVKAYDEGTTNEKWRMSFSVEAPCDDPSNWSAPITKNVDGTIKGSSGKNYRVSGELKWAQESDQSYYLSVGKITVNLMQ